MRQLDRQDIVDLLIGAAILGAGGGGDVAEGLALIDQALDAGKVLRLANLEEVPDETLACCPYLLGAVSPMTEAEARGYAHLPKTSGPAILAAMDRMERLRGRRLEATVACEMGGANTAIAFFVAAMAGGITLDADPAGRAVPEITHSTFYLSGLPAEPICVANNFAETMVLEGVIDDARAETLVRALAQVSAHDVAAVDHALPLHALRQGLIPGTMSAALRLGQCQREAVEQGRDVAQALAEVGEGKVVFAGEVTQAFYETKGGFTLGHIRLEGPAGAYDITVKNENMAGNMNGACLLYTSPSPRDA